MTADEQGHVPNRPGDPGQQADELRYGDDTGLGMSSEQTDAALHAQVTVLDEEIAHLRRRLADAPKRQRALEERLLETKGQLAHAVSQNEKLSYTLREAREHIASMSDAVEKLHQPRA